MYAILPGVTRIRAIRFVVAAAAVVAVALLASSAVATTPSTKNLRALNNQIFAAVNHFRVSHGLTALKRSRTLDKSARVHSIQMGQRGFFGHNSANGEAFWKRVQRYYRSANVGENLLWASPTTTAASALQQWINSPPHLKNLKTARWRDFGVSAVMVTAAPAYYHGRTVTVITTDFGAK